MLVVFQAAARGSVLTDREESSGGEGKNSQDPRRSNTGGGHSVPRGLVLNPRITKGG